MLAALSAKAWGWVAAGAAAVAYGAYEFFQKPPALQSIKRVTPGGVPVQVVVPVVSTKPVSGQATTPIPPVSAIVSQAAQYVAPTLDNVKPPQQQIPSVITPGGSSPLITVLSSQDVQTALNTLGFGPLTVDGNIGPLSIAAVKRFQSVNGLTVDGVPGPLTKNALTAALAEMAASNATSIDGPAVQSAAVAAVAGAAQLQSVLDNLQSASPSPIDVSTNIGVQEALNRLGASPTLTEDGVIGPMSTAAIKAFQISHGLTSDGIAGPMTKAALASALGQA